MAPGTDRCALPVPLVGIGVSSGGIEALQTLLAALPPGLDLAYVVSVHPSSDHSCNLPATLRRNIQLPVEEMSDGRPVTVEAGHVYVVPTHSKFEIAETMIRASPLTQPDGLHAPVDNCFRSLAAQQGGGFGVVLSGDGSDGVVGARCIRAAGGIVLVQDPQEAIQKGMTHAVVSSGVADFVLPVRDLATRLAELSRQVRGLASGSEAQGDARIMNAGEVTSFRRTLELFRKEESRATTRELETSREEFQRINEELKAKEEFLSMLGHELRNPLAAIQNSVALYNATVLAGKGQEELYETTCRTLAVVARQSRHMSRLVNDLLDISRVKQGSLNLRREPVDVNVCMAHVMQDIEPEMQQRGVALEDALVDGPIYMEGDPDRLTQIFENLLRNAMTYTNPGGNVRVESRIADDHAIFSVRDTGIGIGPQDMASLFEPYYRGSQAERGHGMGLGLTLCERLVLLHDGTIEVSSDGVGCGSEFTVTFPLGDSPAAREEKAELPPAVKGRRILVVDDDEDTADMFAAVLASMGQDVEVAYEGPSALEIARTRPPDVVFVDLSMPIMDGIEFARRLRSHLGTEAPAIVALSGYTKDNLSCDDGLFDHHLLKPVSVTCVAELLESLPV